MIIKKIKVVGSGTAGLMAATFIKSVCKDLYVEIYRDSNLQPLIVGESTQPYLSKYFDTVFGDNKEWLTHCNATYKFYVKHNNWNYNGHEWIFPFCHEHLSNDIDCENKVFTYNEENLPPATLYAYHLQSTKLQPLLLQKCEDLGILVYNHHVENLSLLAEPGDFIIDCRGFRGQDSRIPVSPAIINDYALAGHVPFREKRYFTQTFAHSVGWSWEIPLQDQLGVGRVFSTKYLSIEEAKKEMYNWYKIKDLYEVRFPSRFNPNPWNGNCLKIGGAAVFIEPLESTTLTIISFMLESFCKILIDNGFLLQKEIGSSYNAGFRQMVENHIAYVEGAYCLSSRRDSPYWQYVTQYSNWYIDKLEKNGWPIFYGKYGYNKFFTSFGKKYLAKNISIKESNG